MRVDGVDCEGGSGELGIRVRGGLKEGWSLPEKEAVRNTAANSGGD